jgi:DNA replication protein DnaC
VACPRCNDAGFVYANVPPGHPDFGRAIPCECTLKELEESRLTRLQRYSNLGALTRLTFDNLIPQGKGSNPSNQERFSHAFRAALAFAQDPQGWLILTGPSGCGKTHLATAIANHRHQQGYHAFFQVVPDLLDHLRSAFSPNSEITYDELFEQVQNAPLLILDDLGTQSTTPWAQEKLFQLINYRFNTRKPTVITTNISLDELDERWRTRLTDPSLAQIYLLEEKKVAIPGYTGGLPELLNKMTFDKFDSKRVNLPSEQRHNLGEAFRLAQDFANSPEGWLILQGTNGCGKTHLAAAIANHRLQKGEPVSFTIVSEFLDHLRSTFSPESKVTYDELFESVKNAPVLILDDFGEHSSTPWAEEKLYQLINYRYNGRLPTAVTTCSSLEDIETRVSSRMSDPTLSLVFYITAPDYRTDRPPVVKPKSISRRGRRD